MKTYFIVKWNVMGLLGWSLVLVVCLFVVVKSADYFTEYSERLGLAMGLSSFIIGATIVAVGTSLPELVSSIFAIRAGETAFVVDNIIGSNIANALLILGIGAVFSRTLKVKTSLIDIDLPFFFSSMALFAYFALDQSITAGEGLFLLIFFIIFVVYTVRTENEETKEVDKEELEDITTKYDNNGKAVADKKSYSKYLLIIAVSVIGLAVSAKYLIDSILAISTILTIGSSLLTITVVAFGTSLPEVLTSIAAIKRGNHAIAIGNVFGSNTFNLTLIGGVPALLAQLQISELTFIIGLPFLIIATFFAIFSTLDNTIRLWEGVAMLFLYGVFIAKVTGVI